MNAQELFNYLSELKEHTPLDTINVSISDRMNPYDIAEWDVCNIEVNQLTKELSIIPFT